MCHAQYMKHLVIIIDQNKSTGTSETFLVLNCLCLKPLKLICCDKDPALAETVTRRIEKPSESIFNLVYNSVQVDIGELLGKYREHRHLGTLKF